MEKEKIKCTHCDDLFRDRYNMWRHFLRKHFSGHQSINDTGKNDKPKPTCSHCGQAFYKTGNLKRHSKRCKKSKHSSSEDFKFNTVREFEEWKRRTEMDAKSLFVKKSNYKLQNGSFRRKYCCHRSGYFKPQGKNIRRLKVLGTNKINAICPAKIIAVFRPSGEVEVSFFPIHVGHSSELQRVTLSKTERAEIAEKIAKKVSFKEIISNIRNSKDPKAKRLQLLTKKDLHNIEKEFKVTDRQTSYSFVEMDEIVLEDTPKTEIKNTISSIGFIDKPTTSLDLISLETGPPGSLLTPEAGPTTGIIQSTEVDAHHPVMCSSEVQQNETFVLPYNVGSIQGDFTSEPIPAKDQNGIEKLKEEMRREFELVLGSIENEEQALNAKKWIYSFHSFVHSNHFPVQLIIEDEETSS